MTHQYGENDDVQASLTLLAATQRPEVWDVCPFLMNVPFKACPDSVRHSPRLHAQPICVTRNSNSPPTLHTQAVTYIVVADVGIVVMTAFGLSRLDCVKPQPNNEPRQADRLHL